MGLEEEEEAEGQRTDALEFLARLLDPHLHSAERRRAIAEPKWSRRKAFGFILVASLVLWGLIIWGILELTGLIGR